QEFAHPRSRFEAECAPTGKHYGMDLRGQMEGAHNIEFLGSGSETSDVSPRDGAAFAENHGAAGEHLILRGVNNANSRYVRKPFHCAKLLRKRAGMLAFDTRQLPICSTLLKAPFLRCKTSSYLRAEPSGTFSAALIILTIFFCKWTSS